MIIPEGKEYFHVVFDPSEINYDETDKVCLIDGDGSPNFPNLALQKISAWEKRNGVKHVEIIKLKHQRRKGILGLSEDSLADIERIKKYDRIYASFIFTRSRPVAELLRKLIPHAFIGGTGVDDYYDMEEGDKRARPKTITQLHHSIENMYPDHTLYESEHANLNVGFWKDPSKYKVPKKYKKFLSEYFIKPNDGTWGRTNHELNITNDLIERYNKALRENGYEDGTTYRGSTRGNGFSSKGCSRKCTFCVVPVIQGDIRPMHYGLIGVINWILPKGFYPTMDEVVELYQAGRLRMRPHIFWSPPKKKKKVKVKGITRIGLSIKKVKVIKKPTRTIKRISPFLTISDNNFPADPTCIEKMDYMALNDIAVNLNQGMDARLLVDRGKYEVKSPFFIKEFDSMMNMEKWLKLEGVSMHNITILNEAPLKIMIPEFRKTFKTDEEVMTWCDSENVPFEGLNKVWYPSGDQICEKLSKIHFINFNGTARQMHFSWDYIGVGRNVIKGLKKLVDEYGLRYSNFTVYCLSGFNTTFEQDYQRVMTLKHLGVDPFVMLFRNVDGSEGTKFDGTPQDWRMKHLSRWTNNKILFKATPFEKYDNYTKELREREHGNFDVEQERMAQLDHFDWLTQDYINHA